MSYSIVPTTNTTGVRRLQTLGAWGLGSSVDSSTVTELIDNGWDAGRLTILMQLGATNEQLMALPYPAGEDEMTSAYNALSLQLSNRPPSPPQPPSAALPTGGNVVRAGSQLSYTASWGNDFSSWNNPNAIQSSVQEILAQKWGIAIDNQFHSSSDLINFSGGSGFVLQVHTTRDYGSMGDIKSIIDGELYNLGVSLKSSSIALTVTGVTPLVTGTQPSTAAASAFSASAMPAANWNAWLQQNLGLLIFGLAAVVVLPPLLRRR